MQRQPVNVASSPLASSARRRGLCAASTTWCARTTRLPPPAWGSAPWAWAGSSRLTRTSECAPSWSKKAANKAPTGADSLKTTCAEPARNRSAQGERSQCISAPRALHRAECVCTLRVLHRSTVLPIATCAALSQPSRSGHPRALLPRAALRARLHTSAATQSCTASLGQRPVGVHEGTVCSLHGLIGPQLLPLLALRPATRLAWRAGLASSARAPPSASVRARCRAGLCAWLVVMLAPLGHPAPPPRRSGPLRSPSGRRPQPQRRAASCRRAAGTPAALRWSPAGRSPSHAPRE